MKKTAAIVVTYNRIDMLRQCLAALEAQSAFCNVLVVDNAGTDGTGAWLEEYCKAHPTVSVHTLPENIGGAGGFNHGLRWAAEAGFDFAWIMDDDCLPHPDALERLLDADAALDGRYGWLSSAAMWTDGSRCSMNVQRETPYKDIDFSKASGDCIPAQMASFVSLFLPRRTLTQYGLPIRDFFIWGDDWEYTRRISRKEACYVVQSSVVTHAMKSNSIVNIASDSPDRLSRYSYAYRNDVFFYRREGIVGWLWILAKDCWHSLQILRSRQPGKLARIRVVIRGFLDGVVFSPEIETIREPATQRNYERR